MVPRSSASFFSGIRLTQVGYPLAHRQKGILDCSRSDRLVFLSFVAVSDAKDDEVGETMFVPRDVAEVRTDANGVAEGGPEAEDFVSSVVGLLGVGGGCDLQSSAEIRVEVVSGARVKSCQGCRCG